MSKTRPASPPVPIALLAIGAIVLIPGGVGYLVTTFLFAFSGGQYRMVGVVNLFALGVIVVGLVAAVGAWLLRSRVAAIKWAVITTGVGWAVAVIAEWLVSFQLGA